MVYNIAPIRASFRLAPDTCSVRACFHTPVPATSRNVHPSAANGLTDLLSAGPALSHEDLRVRVAGQTSRARRRKDDRGKTLITLLFSAIADLSCILWPIGQPVPNWARSARAWSRSRKLHTAAVELLVIAGFGSSTSPVGQPTTLQRAWFSTALSTPSLTRRDRHRSGR